jgi:uncharacterized protein YcbX
MLKITGLFCYPIKSCKGHALERALITPRGIENDRLMMIVDSDGHFLTQREFPKMALIEPALADDALTLAAPGQSAIHLRVSNAGPRQMAQVWRSQCAAVDQGDEAAIWLSDFLSERVRLVRMADEHVRHVSQDYARRADDQTGFADGYPFLLVSQESLDDLNAKLAAQGEATVPMNRFRPNIVIQGGGAFAEDGWSDIEVHNAHGAVRFGIVKPCARCVMTTTDQTTAEVGKEPLRTLNTYRNQGGKIMFAQNLLFVNSGVVALGDSITN